MESMAFGERIKALRTGKGLSQEEVAERLGVSPQSVSKWEHGRNNPELSVLLPLARLLGVSADELLEGPAERHQGWETRWEAAFRKGEHAKALQAAEEALAALPGDREWRFRQANGEYQVAALTEDTPERLRLLHSSEKHFSALLRDFPAFEEAGTMLVQVLLALNRRREAEALAEGMPHREKLSLILLQGEKRTEALRQVITRSTFELLNLLLTEGSPTALDMAGAILDAAGQDPQLVWYQMNLYRQRAAGLCGSGDCAAALTELGALIACAAGEKRSASERSHFLLPVLEPGSAAERRRWILEALAHPDFDPLREEPDFIALLERVEAACEE